MHTIDPKTHEKVGLLIFDVKYQLSMNWLVQAYYSFKAMTFEPASQLLAFVLPMTFQKGDLTFSRASNTPEAIHIAVKPEAKPRHVISTAQLAKGIWRVCLNWSDGRQQYHDEKQINV